MYEVPDWKASVVYNGVSIHRFDAEVDPGAVKMALGIGPVDPMVLFAGRLEWQKGPDLLVEAIPAVLRAARRQVRLPRRRTDARPTGEPRAATGRRPRRPVRRVPQRRGAHPALQGLRHGLRPQPQRALRHRGPRGLGRRQARRGHPDRRPERVRVAREERPEDLPASAVGGLGPSDDVQPFRQRPPHGLARPPRGRRTFLLGDHRPRDPRHLRGGRCAGVEAQGRGGARPGPQPAAAGALPGQAHLQWQRPHARGPRGMQEGPRWRRSSATHRPADGTRRGRLGRRLGRHPPLLPDRRRDGQRPRHDIGPPSPIRERAAAPRGGPDHPRADAGGRCGAGRGAGGRESPRPRVAGEDIPLAPMETVLAAEEAKRVQPESLVLGGTGN